MDGGIGGICCRCIWLQFSTVLILVLMDGGIGEDDVEIRLKETLKS